MAVTEEALQRDIAATIGQTCPTAPWSGDVWRCHGRKYAGDDPSGSLKVSGRYHCGHDRFGGDTVWPALYTSRAEHVALGERLRPTTPENLRNLATQRLSRLHVDLRAVIDLCADGGCGAFRLQNLGEEELCHPSDYRWTQFIGRLARARAEAMLIPSCTRFPEGNLIIFPDRLRKNSSIVVVESVDPNLYVDWTQFA